LEAALDEVISKEQARAAATTREVMLPIADLQGPAQSEAFTPLPQSRTKPQSLGGHLVQPEALRNMDVTRPQADNTLIFFGAPRQTQLHRGRCSHPHTEYQFHAQDPHPC
jgi:hypothetical protein